MNRAVVKVLFAALVPVTEISVDTMKKSKRACR
jgi:hypothetical protein